jgi:hypothetical protein
MVEKNYKKIAQDLISELQGKEREVIVRRFGLEGRKRETLQSIGDSFGITRERVRQIQVSATKKIEPKLERYKIVFESFLDYFKNFGGIRKEESLLKELGKNQENELIFLLSLDERFKKFNQDKDFYSFWAGNLEAVKKAKEVISLLCKKFEKEKKLMTFDQLSQGLGIKKEILVSYLEISKRIQKNEKGLYGLREWPEINPRGVRDKAYLIFKELQKPLHFTEVAKLIEGSNLATVHNELIRDERFVLIGRGIYALREWGYEPGEVKDIILKILKEEKRPLTKEEILEKIKKQRIVKPNTVFLNLSNKKYFERDEKGRYRIKTAQI